jgi:biopolymer transport protein ExbD
MTFRTHCEISKGRVDPAPMVDVVFLLLIFIILSSPFVLQTGTKVKLPTDSRPPDTTFQTLVVTVARDNLFFFNNRPITLDNLRQALTRAVQETRTSELIIKADQQVTHETIVKVLSAALDTGVTVVNLATRPEVPAAGPPK